MRIINNFTHRFFFIAAFVLIFSYTTYSEAKETNTIPITRGEAVKIVVNTYKLKEKNAIFLQYCQGKPDECIFSFSSRSDYDGIKTKPLILYPDVFPAYRFYEEINIATLLDLTRGYSETENSPFKPEQYLTKIEALKIILGGADLLEWKEKFELAQNSHEIPFTDGFSSEQQSSKDSWWYERYISFALEKGLISSSFHPEEIITRDEFQLLLDSTSNYVSSFTKKTDPVSAV